MLDVGCWMLDVRRPRPPKGQSLAPPPPPQSRSIPADRAQVSPETRRSTSDRRSEVLRRVSGESPARPARAPGAVSEHIAGGLIMAIWQPHHKGLSASHWHPGTSVTDDPRCRDGATSLLGVQVSIPGSDRIRSPRSMGILRQFSQAIQRALGAGPALAENVSVNHRGRDIAVAHDPMPRANTPPRSPLPNPPDASSARRPSAHAAPG
jgi:hypothetical protein